MSIFPKWHIDYTDTTDKIDTDTHIGIIDKRYTSLHPIPLLDASVFITNVALGPVRGVTNKGAVVRHFLRVLNA